MSLTKIIKKSTPPKKPYQGMPWIDTSEGKQVLKIWNRKTRIWEEVYSLIYEGLEPPLKTTGNYSTLLWRDTSGETPVLKMLNADNTEWVAISAASAFDTEASLSLELAVDNYFGVTTSGEGSAYLAAGPGELNSVSVGPYGAALEAYSGDGLATVLGADVEITAQTGTVKLNSLNNTQAEVTTDGFKIHATDAEGMFVVSATEPVASKLVAGSVWVDISNPAVPAVKVSNGSAYVAV